MLRGIKCRPKPATGPKTGFLKLFTQRRACHIGMLSVHKYDNGYDGIIHDRPKRMPRTNRAQTFPRTDEPAGVMHAAQFSKTACAGRRDSSHRALQPELDARLSGRRTIHVPGDRVEPERPRARAPSRFWLGQAKYLRRAGSETVPRGVQAGSTKRLKRRLPTWITLSASSVDR